MSALHAAVPAGQEVWRIGFWPAPWAWPEWRYAGGHRWDDAHGVFRTVYAGDTRYACFVEVLAFARPALAVESDYLDIEEDLEDARKYPSPAPGSIPADWLANRPITSAQLTGRYCDVTRSETIAALRPLFIAEAIHRGAADFDASALKMSEPRDLTQLVASYVYACTEEDRSSSFDGVRFASRHGDELGLWAVFERPTDVPLSRKLTVTSESAISQTDPDLARALTLHGLICQR